MNKLLLPQKDLLMAGRASPHPAYGFFVVLMLLFFVGAVPNAFAQTGLKIQLVPEVTAIVPGQPFHVGLFLQHEPGYHTYWKYPGIVGVPTTMEWSLPPGFQAGPLEYPEPEETMMFQIKAQGFERDVMLRTRITPPADLPLGEKVTLTGKATWMCCGRTCHPGTMELSLDVMVAAKNDLHAEWHPLFEKERAASSQTSTAWTASATETGQTVTLKLTPAAKEARPFQAAEPLNGLRFFTEDGWINSDEPQTAAVDGTGNLTLTLRRADIFLGKGPPNRLIGVVRREGGWLEGGRLRSMNVSAPLSR